MPSRKVRLFTFSAVAVVIAGGLLISCSSETPPAPKPHEPWTVETHGGSEARLERVSSGTGVIRVTIPKLVGTEVFNVKVNHGPFQITKGTRYVLRFRAKGDGARTMKCAVGQYHEPWGPLGLYAHVDVLPEWKQFEFPFVGTSSDSDARIFFDLGGSETPVELSDVTLRNESTGKDES